MLTREMGAVKVKAMGQYIPIPQKKRKKQLPAVVKERLNYPTVESYLEEVVNPVQDDNI
ncbi:hypothetical protein [Zhaonella formicivorans]|jgi:hypothetical protein|uniref:hypothetical protein n=1 Tax=Zhaonella formicivorans TaxID=2528593 RepID=UPI001D0F8B7B|nr:hypothetical protein [Zhaonella formicivorans]